VLRRCVDCTNYKALGNHCLALKIEVDAHELDHPGVLAVSALCREYRPVAAAA
jgi:hypothetical protein